MQSKHKIDNSPASVDDKQTTVAITAANKNFIATFDLGNSNKHSIITSPAVSGASLMLALLILVGQTSFKLFIQAVGFLSEGSPRRQ